MSLGIDAFIASLLDKAFKGELSCTCQRLFVSTLILVHIPLAFCCGRAS